MENSIQKFLILTLVSTFLFSCTNNDSEELNLIENSGIDLTYTSIESNIINLINDHRVNKGLPRLNTYNIVSNEAITHTDYMIQENEVSHENFNIRYQNLVTYASATSAAENVAYGYSTAQAVVNAWLNSEGHRDVIENSTFTDFGISTKSDSEGRYYFTNIFIKR